MITLDNQEGNRTTGAAAVVLVARVFRPKPDCCYCCRWLRMAIRILNEPL